MEEINEVVVNGKNDFKIFKRSIDSK